MRIAWFAAGMTGIASVAAAAPFEVVIHTDLDNDFDITELNQIVVQDDGYVATRLATSTGGKAIVFNTISGNVNIQTVAQQGDLVWSGSGTFDSFDDMTVGGTGSNTRITFGATNDSSAAGIFQYQPSLSQQNLIAQDGGGQTLPSPAHLQANSAGYVIYPSNVSGTETIQRYEPGTGNSVALSDGDDDLTDFNSPTAKHAVSGDGSAVFVATDINTSDKSVYRYAIGGGQTTVTGGSSGYAPQQIVGANNSDVLYHAHDSVGGDSALIINNGSSEKVLLEYTRPNTTFLFPTGMISNNGKATYLDYGNYEDFVGGDGDPANRIWFFDSADTNTAVLPSLIAEAGVTTFDGWTVSSLALLGLTTPMVNDNGIVVFHAMIDDGSGAIEALLSWTEAAGLGIIAKTGDSLQIGDDLFQIDTFAYHLIDSAADALKDGLSDTNVVAFGVGYSGVEGSGIAVLKTTVPVPEPTALSLLAVGLPLMLRRQRK